jgi:hypothetical protein
MDDFLITDDLNTLDPQIFSLTELEAERQARRLIMIPSESIAPLAVRKVLGSSFTNIYAEGYPRPETRTMNESQIMDYARQLSTYRRTHATIKVLNTLILWKHSLVVDVQNSLLIMVSTLMTCLPMSNLFQVHQPIMPFIQHSLNPVMSSLAWIFFTVVT